MTATGSVAEAIARGAMRHEAGLVAMSPYEKLGLLSSLVGSVTEQVVRHASVPILTVNAAAQVERSGLLSDVLVAVDGSDLSLKTVPVLRSLGDEVPEQRVTLLYVAHPGEGAPDGPIAEDETLREARCLLEASGVQVRCEIVPGRDVAETIIEVAHAHGARLIACATHGRSALGKLALGSVADALIRQSPLPVLIVR